MQFMCKDRRRDVAILIIAAALSGCLSDDGNLTGDTGSAIGGSGGEPPGSGNSAPTLSGSPILSIVAGEEYRFSPLANDPDNDPLSFSVSNLPLWASFDTAAGAITGFPGLGDVGVYSGIEIVVSDGTASVSLGPFTVEVFAPGSAVGSAVLNWSAPIENESGSALTDLAGYTLYWRVGQGAYLSSVSINNPGLTTYVVENLPTGIYEFVVTARNSEGIESGFSNTATISIR